MTYQCPKGHQSTDSDYCSECGALIGQSKLAQPGTPKSEPMPGAASSSSSGSGAAGQEICPDCGTPRTAGARFCEVCRHDFQEKKTGMAEAIVANQQPMTRQAAPQQEAPQTGAAAQPADTQTGSTPSVLSQPSKAAVKDAFVVSDKLNVVIAVDRAKASSCGIETSIKPDSQDRIFPLDLDENLVGRRSVNKGIYPEIEINDPGVSHRHLKFIKQPDGSFAVLELGSANGTELNGTPVEAGVNTPVKAGDELAIGIWTQLKLVSR